MNTVQKVEVRHSNNWRLKLYKSNLATANWSSNVQTGLLKSLIIHEEKTKEILAVKDVWICDPNYHKIL